MTKTKSRSSFRLVLKPVALSIQITLMAATASISQFAFSNSAAQAFAFKVQSGTLTQALNQFALQAGVKLSLDSRKLANISSSGLVGQYTIEDGFELLLKNTPYTIKKLDNGYTIIEKSQPQARDMGQLNQIDITTSQRNPEAIQLPSITIQAENSVSTENSGSFSTSKASVFKGITNLKEIPQPVTVITREYLDQRALLDFNAVMQNTPGVTINYTDSERVAYYARGHQIDSLQIDGLNYNQSGSLFIQPDTAVLDSIEVLRGASGMLRGSGNPSATVNLRRKIPTKDLQASVAYTLGSWDRKRVEGDLSLPLNQDGSVRARVITVVDERDFFQQARQERKEVFYGALAADLTDSTTAVLSLQQTNLDATGAWGNLPSNNLTGESLNLARSFYLGADWNQWNRYNQQAYFSLEHTFNNNWKFNLDTSYTRMKMSDDGGWGFKQTSVSALNNRVNPYLVNISTSVYDGGKSEQSMLNINTHGEYQLFGRTHQAFIGAEFQKNEVIGSDGYFNINPQNNVDIRHWNPYTSYKAPSAEDIATGTSYDAKDDETTQKAVFARTSLSLTDPLKLILGSRLTWWEYNQQDSPASSYKVDKEFTPFIGLTYDFSPNITAYSSYTDIFTPQLAYNTSGKIIDPIVGKDYELGLKTSWFEDRLNTSLSVFRIENDGKAINDPDSPNPCLPNYINGQCKIAGGLTRSQGWELEVSGELTPQWQIFAGYTNTKTKYIRDTTSSNTGKPIRSADPEHLFQLFTSYQFNDGLLHGLKVGGGVQARSDAYNTGNGLTARQGGYAIYNAMLGYDINKNIIAQVNVNNIFDKVYYVQYSPIGVSNYYGDPRNASISLRIKF